ncbi:hypothetical protein THRCLA_22475 [Thraustotheca clavata]|uniref:Uncharacterized protein n=1 Tax=Thraustotheca clavata TaxID=74557 RepID=A0A1V9Z063_9STRA|nr:hypothetical protein THRCLA_22475 [Thraustotheca clavata]
MTELASYSSPKKIACINALPVQLEPLEHKPKHTIDTTDIIQQFDPNVSPPKSKLEKLSSNCHTFPPKDNFKQ